MPTGHECAEGAAMGKVKRIPVDDIQAMKKTLDALPDKHIGKTREQAADMLLANIQKAIAKGYP